MTDTSTWVTAVAAYGLGPPQGVLTDDPVEDTSWPRFLELARGQRLLGLVRAAAQDGVLALRSEQWTGLENKFHEVTAETAKAERSVVDLVTTLEDSEIDCRVLKGPALAHLDYRSPDLRPFIQPNLLVEACRFVDAVHVLGQLGYHRAHAEPAPGFDAKFRKGTVLVNSAGSTVELHRTIADGPYAMIVEHRELFTTSSEIELAGRHVVTLGPEERLLHACFEARVGDTKPLLIRLRDIVQLVLSHDLDLERIEQLSGSWGAQSLVAEAVRRAWTLLGVTDMVPLSSWATTHPTSRRERRRISRITPPAVARSCPLQTLGAIRPQKSRSRLPAGRGLPRPGIPRGPLQRSHEQMVARDQLGRLDSDKGSAVA